MLFLANLRPESVASFDRYHMRPHGYLLSAHRASRNLVSFAHATRKRGIPLMADNGSKEIIDRVIMKYSSACQSFMAEVRMARRMARDQGRAAVLPSKLIAIGSGLANAIIRECTRESRLLNPQKLLAIQLAMTPTHLIAQEDFAVAVLMALNLDREVTGLDSEALLRRNRRSLLLYRSVKELTSSRGIKVYAVLSAMDYNTAVAAGRLAARSGVTRVALGCVGIMKDGSAVDSFLLRRTSFPLGQAAPRRYVRLAQILRGIVDGYRQAGKSLVAFHALGLGAPSLFPVVAAALSSVREISVDSTAPIRDAIGDHVLYRWNRNGDRATIMTIARELVSGNDWYCRCVFCLGFRKTHGHSVLLAMKWWTTVEKRDIASTDLMSGKPLSSAVPLLTLRNRGLGLLAQLVHIAHNHAVLKLLASRIPDGSLRPQWGMRRIASLAKYEATMTARGLLAAQNVLNEAKRMEATAHAPLGQKR